MLSLPSNRSLFPLCPFLLRYTLRAQRTLPPPHPLSWFYLGVLLHLRTRLYSRRFCLNFAFTFPPPPYLPIHPESFSLLLFHLFSICPPLPHDVQPPPWLHSTTTPPPFPPPPVPVAVPPPVTVTPPPLPRGKSLPCGKERGKKTSAKSPECVTTTPPPPSRKEGDAAVISLNFLPPPVHPRRHYTSLSPPSLPPPYPHRDSHSVRFAEEHLHLPPPPRPPSHSVLFYRTDGFVSGYDERRGGNVEGPLPLSPSHHLHPPCSLCSMPHTPLPTPPNEASGFLGPLPLCAFFSRSGRTRKTEKNTQNKPCGAQTSTTFKKSASGKEK